MGRPAPALPQAPEITVAVSAPIPEQDDAGSARHPVHLVLDNIRSAYNVGAIFRTADAARVERVHLCGISAYPPNDKLAKTALGATQTVPWTYHAAVNWALDALAEDRVPVVAIEEGDVTRTIYDLDWPTPVALVLGNEVTGVSPDVRARCVEIVRIPVWGAKNSLNVATAAGIALFEVLRRWNATARNSGLVL